MEEYTEVSIKVLSQAEIYEKIPFERYSQLADKYGKDLNWLKRAFESCIEAGVPEQYIIDRYLRKLDTPLNESVDYQHRQLHKFI